MHARPKPTHSSPPHTHMCMHTHRHTQTPTLVYDVTKGCLMRVRVGMSKQMNTYVGCNTIVNHRLFYANSVHSGLQHYHGLVDKSNRKRRPMRMLCRPM